MATHGDLEKGGGGARKEAGKVPSPLYPQHEGEREWVPWIVPVFFVANITVFVVTMYVNNCPAHAQPRDGKCIGHFFGRFAFQPLRENPLIGPSSATSVIPSFFPFFFLFNSQFRTGYAKIDLRTVSMGTAWICPVLDLSSPELVMPRLINAKLLAVVALCG